MDAVPLDLDRLDAFADLVGLTYEAELSGDALDDTVRRRAEEFFSARLSVAVSSTQVEHREDRTVLGPSIAGRKTVRADRGQSGLPFSGPERSLWLLLMDQVAKAERASAVATAERDSLGRALSRMLAPAVPDADSRAEDDSTKGAPTLRITASLQSACCLTDREAQLLDALLSHRTLKRAAADLRISWETARRHLKNVLEKTGTASQVELIRFLLCRPAGLVRTEVRAPAPRRSPGDC